MVTWTLCKLSCNTQRHGSKCVGNLHRVASTACERRAHICSKVHNHAPHSCTAASPPVLMFVPAANYMTCLLSSYMVSVQNLPSNTEASLLETNKVSPQFPNRRCTLNSEGRSPDLHSCTAAIQPARMLVFQELNWRRLHNGPSSNLPTTHPNIEANALKTRMSCINSLQFAQTGCPSVQKATIMSYIDAELPLQLRSR